MTARRTRDGVGDLAAEREPHGQVARRVDAQGWVGRLVRDAREHLPAVLVAGVQQRPAALEVDGVDDLRRRRLGQGALEQPRRGRQRPEPSRGIGGTAQRGHDGGVAARRRAHQVLGDALVVQPRRRRAARPRARAARRRPPRPIASRAAAATTGCVKAYARASSTRSPRSSSSAAIASDGSSPASARARASSASAPSTATARASAVAAGREPLEPVGDEPHELRRRAAIVERVAAGVGEQLAEIQRVAAGRRARPRDERHRPRAPQHRLDQPRGAGDGERRRLEPHERALGSRARRAA